MNGEKSKSVRQKRCTTEDAEIAEGILCEKGKGERPKSKKHCTTEDADEVPWLTHRQRQKGLL